MNMKACTEEYLKSSGVDYTILRLCGFMQVRGSRQAARQAAAGSGRSGRQAAGLAILAAPSHGLPTASREDCSSCRARAGAGARSGGCLLGSPPPLPPPKAVIGNYAVPILEDKTVWGTNDETRTAYLDATDTARMVGCPGRAAGMPGAGLPARLAARGAAAVGWGPVCQRCCPRGPALPGRRRSGRRHAGQRRRRCPPQVMAALRTDAAAGKTLTLSGPKVRAPALSLP
jgi:hypothetical protein